SITPPVTSETISHTEICAVCNANELYTLTIGFTASETRYIHKIVRNGPNTTVNLLTSRGDGSGWGRACIAYDAYNDWLWTGGVSLYGWALANTSVIYFAAG